MGFIIRIILKHVVTDQLVHAFPASFRSFILITTTHYIIRKLNSFKNQNLKVHQTSQLAAFVAGECMHIHAKWFLNCYLSKPWLKRFPVLDTSTIFSSSQTCFNNTLCKPIFLFDDINYFFNKRLSSIFCLFLNLTPG